MNQVSHLGAQRICVYGVQVSWDRRVQGGSHQQFTFDHRGEEKLNLLIRTNRINPKGNQNRQS